MAVPLIALEVVVGFVVPVGWGVWELLALRRDRRERESAGEREREREGEKGAVAEPGAATDGPGSG